MRFPNGTARTPRDDKRKPKYKDQYGNYVPRIYVLILQVFDILNVFFTVPTLSKRSQEDGEVQQDGLQKTFMLSLLLESCCFIIYVVYYHLRFQSEIMAGRIQIDYSVSRVTLGFFEDSGWYTVDYSKAMKWEYGRQLGCDFCMKSCFDYAEIRRQYGRKIIPFCDNVNEARCRDAFSYGTCSILRYQNPVPIEDRFFLKAPFDTQYGPEYFGGEDPFKDYCPTMVYVKGLGSEYSATSFCTHQENEKLSREGINRYYQTYGSKGICVEHRSVWTYTDKYIYTLGTYLKGSCHKVQFCSLLYFCHLLSF
ncbi:unnamed protein product [Schistosoma curassoni]|uniref:Leishmanolysin-like peptidase n=1 Tax=Schistosoma curassoni TaxID=6186 RepID=A0A183JWU7_9TREM|nr:unnamed protein product [Schistosoma curassoni]